MSHPTCPISHLLFLFPSGTRHRDACATQVESLFLFSLSLHTPFLPYVTPHSSYTSHLNYFFSLSLHTPFLPYVTPHSSHISHLKFAFSVRRIGRCGHADWTAEGRRRARTARGRAALGPRVVRLPKVVFFERAPRFGHGKHMFSVSSLNVAPPLLPHVQNLIQ